jgi:hypothetical protein
VLPARFPPLHDRVELRRGGIAQLSGAGLHAAHGRRAQLTQQLVVVHADHGHFIRHIQIVGATRLEHLTAAGVVGGHHAERFRQFA